MNGSFFKKSKSSSAAAENTTEARRSCHEHSVVDSLLLIKKVAYGRTAALREGDVADVVQETALRLWKWLGKYGDRGNEMTGPDWESFTARTAHNEINRYWSNRIKGSEVSLDEVHSIPGGSLEGDANAEMISLVKNVWQEICILSLRQRRSLLLHSPELVLYFFQYGIEERAIANVLGMDDEEWRRVLTRLPLTDIEIAEITRDSEDDREIQLVAHSVKKARFDARKRLKRLKR
ncbi:MAG: RNA polymerase sigma factor [Pyrinomonadaceae bacterium]